MTFSIMTFRKTTQKNDRKVTFKITRLRKITLTIITLSIMKLSIMTLSITN